MDKRNFVIGHQPSKADFDGMQNDMEDGLNRVARLVAGKGIHSGFDVAIAGSTATVSAGMAFDGIGNPIVADKPVTVDLGTITRPAAGKYKWATIILRFQVSEAGTVKDLYGNGHPAQYKDSLAAVILQSDEGTAAAIKRPDPSNVQVPIIDIRVDATSPWENLVTDLSRRPSLITVADASSRITKLQTDFDAAFPVGTIWMYDGSDWQDNVTLPGWYACIPKNEDGGAAGLAYGITSMVDRFVMGKSVTGSGATGGSNSYRLTAAQLPAHTHTINHDHPSFVSGNQRQTHRHHLALDANTAGSHPHSIYGRENKGSHPLGQAIHSITTGMRSHRSDIIPSAGNHSHHTSGWTGWISAGHNHDIDIPAFTGNSGSTGLGAAVDNRPAFYSMIFIRKCV